MIEAVLAAVSEVFAGVPQAAPFLTHWPQGGVTRWPAPKLLPVCRWLDSMGQGGVMGKVCAAAPGLCWQQTYGAADFGPEFLQGYGWSEFIGLRGPVASEKIACGVLLLAPGVTYPAHAHQAEEVYLPISGVADWQQGEGDFSPVAVGQAIHHAPWVPHAMRVGADPLAALYLWQGGDLAAKSVIVGR